MSGTCGAAATGQAAIPVSGPVEALLALLTVGAIRVVLATETAEATPRLLEKLLVEDALLGFAIAVTHCGVRTESGAKDGEQGSWGPALTQSKARGHAKWGRKVASWATPDPGGSLLLLGDSGHGATKLSRPPGKPDVCNPTQHSLA